MGKISVGIQMLNYLNTGNKYSVKELSFKLGISERMVRYYKKELEESGIPIETFMGPGGGYYIVNGEHFYNCFNKYDIQLLDNVYKILEKNNYDDKDKFLSLIEKVKINYDIVEDKSKYYQINKYENKDQIFNILNKAAINKESIDILYRNLNHEWKKRTIFPLQIFKYNNKTYVTAFCKLRGDIRHFEFDRIKILKK